MFKKLVFLFLFVSLVSNAQHTIKGELKPAGNFEWLIMYQLQGAKQNYIVDTKIKDGQFTIVIPEQVKPGVYRLIYNLKNRLFVDIIYNNEDIEFTLNPDFPSQTIEFISSDENKMYTQYLNETSTAQQKLDSLQIAYFSAKTQVEKKNIEKKYSTHFSKLKDLQQWFEKESEQKLVYNFIKAMARFNAEKPIKEPETYLNDVKNHFFDTIDFSDEILLNSTIINTKINDFIFYLDNSDDKTTLLKLRKKAIETVLIKIKENKNLTKNIQEGLLYNFVQQQNVELTKFILTEHYEKLPSNYQDLAFIKDIKGQLRTAVGMQVPNFTWKEKNLYSLKESKYYIVIFWSSTCGHCLKELPVVYTYLKDRKDVQVLAIGLEDEKSKIGWIDEVHYYPKWIHILGKNKWKNKIARAYGIHATPTYIILDKEKKVLAKPDDFKALEAFFSVKK